MTDQYNLRAQLVSELGLIIPPGENLNHLIDAALRVAEPAVSRALVVGGHALPAAIQRCKDGEVPILAGCIFEADVIVAPEDENGRRLPERRFRRRFMVSAHVDNKNLNKPDTWDTVSWSGDATPTGTVTGIYYKAHGSIQYDDNFYIWDIKTGEPFDPKTVIIIAQPPAEHMPPLIR